jgi:hypothetical protein
MNFHSNQYVKNSPIPAPFSSPAVTDVTTEEPEDVPLPTAWSQLITKMAQSSSFSRISVFLEALLSETTGCNKWPFGCLAAHHVLRCV